MTTCSTLDIPMGDGTRQFFFRPQTSDELVVRVTFKQRQYDLNRLTRAQELAAFIRRHEAQGKRPLVVDVGANIGATAIWLLRNFPMALIVAVEPDAGNFELLCRNVEGLAITPIRAAIASSAGRARVFDAGIGHWGLRTCVVLNDTSQDTVACLTINDIFTAHAADFVPFLVKVDIEGAEGELFSANTEWVARTPLIIIELHDWLLPKAGTSASFLRCISQLDRDFVSLGEENYSIAHNLNDISPVASTLTEERID